MIMKKRLLMAFLLLTCLLSVQVTVNCRETARPVRIRFKPGESSATLKGRLTSRKLQQNFLIGARANQIMFVEIQAQTSDGLNFANFHIADPSGKYIASDGNAINGITRVVLKQSGDYRIDVSPPGSFYNEKLKGYKELQFRLSVRIE